MFIIPCIMNQFQKNSNEMTLLYSILFWNIQALVSLGSVRIQVFRYLSTVSPNKFLKTDTDCLHSHNFQPLTNHHHHLFRRLTTHQSLQDTQNLTLIRRRVMVAPAEDRVSPQASPSWICGGQRDGGTGFSEYFGFFLPVSFHQGLTGPTAGLDVLRVTEMP
jgi:hypothetical protein